MAAAGPLEDADAALKRQDYATALKLLRPLANQGNVKAQGEIGEMYEKGLGVTPDRSEAMKWYGKAADAIAQGILPRIPCAPTAAGDPSAGYNAQSCGDYATALRIFRPQAEQGDPNAQLMLGRMYENGQGVAQSYSEAMQWYRKAADQGNAGAEYSLGYMYDSGEVAQDYSEAEKWYRLAADQGDSGAQTALGEIYKAGHSVQQNDDEAAKWIHKADNQVNSNAELAYGLQYY